MPLSCYYRLTDLEAARHLRRTSCPSWLRFQCAAPSSCPTTRSSTTSTKRWTSATWQSCRESQRRAKTERLNRCSSRSIWVASKKPDRSSKIVKFFFPVFPTLKQNFLTKLSALPTATGWISWLRLCLISWEVDWSQKITGSWSRSVFRLTRSACSGWWRACWWDSRSRNQTSLFKPTKLGIFL